MCSFAIGLDGRGGTGRRLGTFVPERQEDEEDGAKDILRVLRTTSQISRKGELGSSYPEKGISAEGTFF